MCYQNYLVRFVTVIQLHILVEVEIAFFLCQFIAYNFCNGLFHIYDMGCHE